MMRFDFTHFEQIRHSTGLNRLYRQAADRPAWIWQTTLTVGLLVFLLPLLLLAVSALVVMAAVFLLLSGAHRLSQWLGRVLGRTDPEGRINVRVIHRQ